MMGLLTLNQENESKPSGLTICSSVKVTYSKIDETFEIPTFTSGTFLFERLFYREKRKIW